MRPKTANRKTLWCLHGNLQQPEVWHPLAEALQAHNANLQIRLINLWETSADSCWAWAEAFCHTVQSVALRSENEHYLLGYSLGGRLAWHGLITKPELWAGAVIVSADVGVANVLQKEECLRRDRTWAYRFLTEPWAELLAKWDAVPVFCDRPCPTARSEKDFDRQQIARFFEVYSKGHMDNLVHSLRSMPMPITYVTGIDDGRYCQLGQMLSLQCPTLTHITVKDAGHRVPWEQPAIFFKIVQHSLNL